MMGYSSKQLGSQGDKWEKSLKAIIGEKDTLNRRKSYGKMLGEKLKTTKFLCSIQLLSARQLSGGARAPKLPSSLPRQPHIMTVHLAISCHNTQQPGRHKTLEAYN